MALTQVARPLEPTALATFAPTTLARQPPLPPTGMLLVGTPPENKNGAPRTLAHQRSLGEASRLVISARVAATRLQSGEGARISAARPAAEREGRGRAKSTRTYVLYATLAIVRPTMVELIVNIMHIGACRSGGPH